MTFDLSVKDPNGDKIITYRSPGSIMNEIDALDSESEAALRSIKALL